MIETYRIPTLDGGWIEVDKRGGVTTVKITEPKGDFWSARTSAIDLDDNGTRSLIDELAIPNVTRLSDRTESVAVGASGGIVATVRRVV